MSSQLQKNNIEIIPAILPKDFDELERKLALLKDAYLILGEKKKPIVQVDICDGNFVPTQTWPYSEGNSLEQLIAFSDDFDFEIDLMIKDPKSLIPDLQKIGVKRIILHIESLTGEPSSELFENFDVSASQFGFAVNLQTPMRDLGQYIRDADFFQFMGISRIGFQGEKFNKGVLKKIKAFHKENPDIIISVDGGVNLKNGKDLIIAGVSRLAVGSAIFTDNNAEEVAKVIKKFRNKISAIL